MNEKINKTSICSIVFLDIIDYSKKSVSEQIDIKNQFNLLINHSLKDVEPEDRIILDTGDGAAIAHLGSPEDALFVSLSIRDEILKSNIMSAMPLYVRFGINLGPVRLVTDINGQPNIIGDGINVAQRIMSFAKPNQIVVSRSYYDVTSRLTQEISQMFDYSGIKHDKHVREHEIYAVRLLKDATPEAPPDILTSLIQPTKQILNPVNWFSAVNWKYTALALPAFVAFVMVIKTAATPQEPLISFVQNAEALPASQAVAEDLNALQQSNQLSAANLTPKASIDADLTQKIGEQKSETVEVQQLALSEKSANQALDAEKPIKAKVTKQKVAKKVEKAAISDLPPAYEAPVSHNMPTTKTAANATDFPMKTQVETVTPEEKSTWNSFKDSVKQGQKGACSQVQISMNQCQQ